MGARLHLPALGLLASVDPVEGGTDNVYTYVNDPINQYDLNGQINWSRVWKAAKGAVVGGVKWQDRTTRWAISTYINFEWKNRMKIIGTVAFVLCVLASAGVCLTAGIASSVASVVNATVIEHKPGFQAAALAGADRAPLGDPIDEVPEDAEA
ncbi:hypothetical protein [Cellulomonas citrea]|uniref:hypothetical protein n=1 Tax=Cellulomonas citrea TaxID=1909423 RepID=UPI001359B2B4|nr:hypothetical protein [Cellulomonas citrea]